MAAQAGGRLEGQAVADSGIFGLGSIVDSVQSLTEQGGSFVILIFASGVLMWALFLERMAFFRRALPIEMKSALVQWHARPDPRSWTSYQVRRQLISQVNVAMNRGIPLLAVLVPVSPLLGLVGTVTGMLEVFDSMAIHGSADARAMASGVSQAMVCTLTGLAVSISGLYPVYYVRTRIARELETLSDRLVV